MTADHDPPTQTALAFLGKFRAALEARTPLHNLGAVIRVERAGRKRPDGRLEIETVGLVAAQQPFRYALAIADSELQRWNLAPGELEARAQYWAAVVADVYERERLRRSGLNCDACERAGRGIIRPDVYSGRPFAGGAYVAQVRCNECGTSGPVAFGPTAKDARQEATAAYRTGKRAPFDERLRGFVSA